MPEENKPLEASTTPTDETPKPLIEGTKPYAVTVNVEEVQTLGDVSVDQSAFEDELEAASSPHPKGSKLTIPLVYNDPGAEKVAQRIDAFSIAFLEAFMDPKHVFHKTMSGPIKEKFAQLIFSHNELRHKLGHTKQKYYHPMVRDPSDIVATVGIQKQGYSAAFNIYE